MGFLSGRVSFIRYRVRGRSPRQFKPEHLERLQAHAIGRQRVASSDGVEVGWGAGDHILDTRFDLAKNIIDDALHYDLRLDSVKLPADLLRAYAQVELEGVAAVNPSGLPSARQKREARQAARERLESEARDGRFLRRKAYPILWDARSNELLVGTTTAGALERLHRLFQQTFDLGLEPVAAGLRAFLLAEPRGQTRGVDDATPTSFTPGGPDEQGVSWIRDEHSRDFVGNEFLLWLWYMQENDHDTLELADGSEATFMLARDLVLECPRGQTGRETIRSDGPASLPEALRAIQAGKLPRRAGLTVLRHGEQYEVTLHAENLGVTGAKLPAPEEENERAQLEERIQQIRQLMETLDLLYDAFGNRRFGEQWSTEAQRMKKWLQQEPRPAISVTA